MNDADIEKEKKGIEKTYGPWTAHNFSLGQHVFTIKEGVTGDEVKLRRVVQVVSDLCGRPINELRLLDLACLEGMYGIEFARQGAHVCAIEGREASLEKARFAARVLSLSNVEFHLDDVRNLSKDKYGKFDVVLCLGILYHLTTPDIFNFVEKLSDVCGHMAVIDTHISPHPDQSYLHNGRQYWGKQLFEHSPDASPAEKKNQMWASLDNETSVCFTRSSLYSLLYDAGFTSIYECHVPQEPQKPADRITLVAIKGTTRVPVGSPQLPAEFARDFPEQAAPMPLFRASTSRPGFRLAGKLLPQRLRRWARRVLPGK